MVSNVCQCNSGLFLNQTQCAHCAAMPGCLTCNIAGCTSCNPIFRFTLNNSTNTCQCNVGYFLDSMSICEPCTQFGCVNCLSLTNCVQCDASYSYLSGGTCKDICGDGLLYTLPCDDGNTINGDGCSSTCTV
jgi:proprotein convertase subtilisin/kexin type 5